MPPLRLPGVCVTILSARVSVWRKYPPLAKNGICCGDSSCTPHRQALSAPSGKLPDAPVTKQQQAIVIGGGLAGTSTARSLAERGWRVTLLEQHGQLAKEASGNPQGILYAKLSPHHTPLSRFILQGYLYSINLLNQLQDRHSPYWYQTSVIQMPVTDKEYKRHKALAEQFPDDLLFMADSEQLATLTGFRLNRSGLVFPKAGWVKPARFCQSLADHPAIQTKTGHRVAALKKEGSEWVLLNKQQEEIIRSEVVVVAGGVRSHQFPELEHLPVKPIRGQLSQVAETASSSRLSVCLCSEGYIAPACDHEHTLGATFDFNDDCLSVRKEDHQRNLDMLLSQMPEVYAALGKNSSNSSSNSCSNYSPDVTGGRTGFRCTTPDYLPLVGPVVNRDSFIKQFALLRKDAKALIDGKADYFEGLYVNTGHGSRGLVTCPLSGEIIASMISGDNNVVEHSLLDALNPTRFLIRNLIKKNI